MLWTNLFDPNVSLIVVTSCYIALKLGEDVICNDMFWVLLQLLLTLTL